MSPAHRCIFCDRTFSRVDAAKRHCINCPARDGQPIPPAAKRGRKLRACDECSRSKVSCSGIQPCTRCSARGVICTSARPNQNNTHSSVCSGLVASPQAERKAASAGANCATPFLLNCTDPRLNFVKDVMVEEDSGSPPTPVVENQSSCEDLMYETIDPQLLLFGFLDLSPNMSSPSDPFRGNAGFSTLFEFNINMFERVKLLEVTLCNLGTSLPNFDDLDRASFTNFFTCGNFDTLTAAFFSRPQLLARIIHLPTFDAPKADLTLLLAIVLVGVAYSRRSTTSPTDILTVDMIRRLAEKFIFKRLKSRQPDNEEQVKLETCQAAYLMTTLLISTNEGSSRRRAMAKRQPALVRALRRLDLIDSWQAPSVHEADWPASIYQESCARLTSFVMFNDGLLALLCNNPPNMTVSQLNIKLPSGNGVWEASDSSTFAAAQSRGQPMTMPTVRHILTDMMEDDWSPYSDCYLKSSVFHLYTIIGAFQILLFNFRANLPQPSLKSVLIRFLDRWDQLWLAADQRVLPEDRPWLGVVKHAPEFALVSRWILEAIGNRTEQSRYLQCVPQDDFDALHEFILEQGRGRMQEV